MIYLIDFDTRSVESKSDDGELLASYILDNDLNIAVALVSEEDELTLQFSLNELQDLYNNLADDHGERAREFDTEEQAAEFCWLALENNQTEFPKFTKRLGKKLLKPNENPEKIQNTNKGRSMSKTTNEDILLLGTEPKKNTSLHRLWSLVDDNLGEINMAQLISDYVFENSTTEKLARRYIVKSIRQGNLLKAGPDEI